MSDRREYFKKYHKEHRDKKIENSMIWNEEHKEELIIKRKKRYEDNREEEMLRQKKYREDNREVERLRVKKWREDNPEKWKEVEKKYRYSNKGKINDSKHQAKRNRELGYIPLNDRFEGCEGHHVDNERIIFIPSEMHKDNWHRQCDPESMIEINKLAFEFLEMR